MRLARRYLELLAGAFATGLMLAACLAVAMDPYVIFGTPRVDGLNRLKPAAATRVRVAKPFALERGNWRTLIVGNSRPELGIDPDSIEDEGAATL